MKIELHEISIREVVENYVDNDEEGVLGFGGKLNIRPKYQREFVYDEQKRAAVVDTIRKGFPLNVMYWIKNDDGTFELMDGQQRTVSFCQYVQGAFSIRFNDKLQFFFNLTEPEREQILNYKLLVYFCEGSETEKLEWFRVINIAGLQLKEQEMLNATHTGPWLSHAKAIFSKNNCPAYLLSKDYVKAEVNRQGLLEVALKWISGGEIEKYMCVHQHDPNANELWTYFRNVIGWVQLTFPHYRSEMKGIDWGGLYGQYKDIMYDTGALEQEIKALMIDDEVQKKAGVYPYCADPQRKIFEPARLFSGAEAGAVRKTARRLSPLRWTLRHQRDGGRPHQTVEQGRKDDSGKLSDALPRVQPAQGQQIKKSGFI